MQLNHLDLHVPNVFETRDFFVSFFGFELKSSPTASAIAILENEEGFVLVLQKQKNEGDRYPEGFHVGFYVAQKSIVDVLQAQMRAMNLTASDIESNRRGYFFYVKAPGGFLVEVNSRD